MHTAVVSHLVLLVPVRDGNDECFWCVCVLTGLWNKKYDRIMRWWGSKPQSGIDEVLESAAYCYVLLPRLPCYSSTSCSYQTSSSTHLGFPCLQPSIYAYQTKSFTHLGISRIRTIILTSQPSLAPSRRLLLCGIISKYPPPLCLLQDSCQGGPDLFLCRLLAPPSLPTTPTPFAILIPCTKFK